MRMLSGEEAVKKSPFSLELNENPNEDGRVAIEFVRYFFSSRVQKNYLFLDKVLLNWYVETGLWIKCYFGTVCP